jgi:predicted DCC family thiol-disulfide oxidoreductase YuxK
MTAPSLIIYDGDCVFCQNYVRFVRLREAIGPVELIDARSDDPRARQMWREGYDLNEGMVFVHHGRVYYGADAINILANLSDPRTVFNSLNRAIFSSPFLSRTLYPVLKIGRRLTLLARGKPLLADPARLEH